MDATVYGPTREQVDKSFAKDIRDHKVRIVSYDGGCCRVLRCSRPDSWVFGFHIVTHPGSIYMNGDMGSMGVERTTDMFRFVRGSIGSLSYFMEKVPKEFVARKFVPELANAYIDGDGIVDRFGQGEELTDEQKEELQELREDAYRDWDDASGEWAANQFFRTLNELRHLTHDGVNVEFPIVHEYDYHTLWRLKAMEWAVAQWDAGEAVVHETCRAPDTVEMLYQAEVGRLRRAPD